MSMQNRRAHEMIDLHMHVIPGVDDGALDLPMSLAMLRLAWAQGVRAVCATPHSGAFQVLPGEVRERFHRLRQAAAALLPELRLYLGCEVYCEVGRMAEVVDALAAGRFPTMGGTAYVLMELSPWGRAEALLPCAEALVRAGYRPILAHAERYACLQGDLTRIDQFRAMGGTVQLNAYSLAEEEDSAIRAWAQQLVKTRRADYLGTDAHRTYHRPPRVQAGLDWLYAAAERPYADALAWGNAQKTPMEAAIC